MQNKNLSNIIIKKLILNKETIAIAESCTGGLLSYQFTKINNASNMFAGSIIAYQNETKIKILNVKEETIKQYTPYSNEVVIEMLNGIIELLDSTYAIATSGIAGPCGGDNINPVGSVYIGLRKKRGEIKIIKKIFKGDRNSIQMQSSIYAMELFLELFLDEKILTK